MDVNERELLRLEKRPRLIGFRVAFGAIGRRLIGDRDHGEAIGWAPADQEEHVEFPVFSGMG